jgi:maltoporin
VFNKTEDLTTVYASFEGLYKFTQATQVEYILAFHDYDNSRDKTDNRKNYNAIVRPMHWWNDVHSTWLEAGWQHVDYDNGGDNKGWKLTLSQNMSIAMGPEFRPMLRFYVTGGKVDNERTAREQHQRRNARRLQRRRDVGGVVLVERVCFARRFVFALPVGRAGEGRRTQPDPMLCYKNQHSRGEHGFHT